MTTKKLAVGIVILLIIAVAAGCVAMTQFKDDKKKEQTEAPAEEEVVEEPEPEPIVNPLTGSFDFDEETTHQRVVGFVVENAQPARPQVGMDDEKYPPDIIVEGEVEGGISRMFWMFADYNKLPETIGPMRSARPPFIRFAAMFDSYFIHWGMSHTEGGYIGANTVFRRYNTDHIDQMHFANESNLYFRDYSLGQSQEHTGRVHGENVPAALEEADFRTEPKERTKLKWREENGPVGKKTADEVTVTFSNRSGNTHWVYDKEKNVYKTDSFRNNTTRDNLIILTDKTRYVTNAIYLGHGVTYCDYLMKGGKGYVISNGTWTRIKWRRDGQKLILYKEKKTKIPKTEDEIAADRAAAEAEGKDPDKVKDYNVEVTETEYELNRGRSWIGWISRNNGGKVDIKGHKVEKDEDKDKEKTEDSGESEDSSEA